MVTRTVQVNGAALAALLADVATVGKEAEGLIIGTINRSVSETVNDESDTSITETIVSVIESFRLVGSHCTFYGSDGRVSVDRLAIVAGDVKGRVLGWFRFRRDLPLIPSLRETAVHADLISHTNNNLLFGLLTLLPRDNEATWCVDYAFAHQDESTGQLKRIPLMTENLSQGTATASMPLALQRHAVRVEPLFTEPARSHWEKISTTNIASAVDAAYAATLEQLGREVGTLMASQDQIARLKEQIETIKSSLEETSNRMDVESNDTDLIDLANSNMMEPTDLN